MHDPAEPVLTEAAAAADPIDQFRRWYDDPRRLTLAEPDAVTLATADPDGRPSARTVLLRGFDARGFVFYTHYTSRKGRELEANPRAALLFYWPEPSRQVRIEGAVSRVSQAESDAYFAARAWESRIGALASPQSQPLGSRAELDERYRSLAEEHRDRDVPRPEQWGGYRLVPDVMEFWQARSHRLHDRLEYRRDRSSWRMRRLAP